MADENFKQEFLETHNAYRAKHKAPPMKLNSELNASAQNWANYLLQRRALQHSQCRDGENIYNMCSSTIIQPKGREAVDAWYNEIKDYNWGRPGFASNTGHFTQVVWKESTELGVGMATDGRMVMVVGQYRPAGNMNTREYFMNNVLPPASREVDGADNTSSGGGEMRQRKTCTLL